MLWFWLIHIQCQDSQSNYLVYNEDLSKLKLFNTQFITYKKNSVFKNYLLTNFSLWMSVRRLFLIILILQTTVCIYQLVLHKEVGIPSDIFSFHNSSMMEKGKSMINCCLMFWFQNNKLLSLPLLQLVSCHFDLAVMLPFSSAFCI